MRSIDSLMPVLTIGGMSVENLFYLVIFTIYLLIEADKCYWHCIISNTFYAIIFANK